MSAKRLHADGEACKPRPKRDREYEYLGDSSEKDRRWSGTNLSSVSLQAPPGDPMGFPRKRPSEAAFRLRGLPLDYSHVLGLNAGGL